jgi:thiamine-phosphate pyrophosphorylase
MAADRTRLRGLYAISDRHLCGDAIVQKTRDALLGGARIIQYRDKGSDQPRRLREAVALAALCRAHDALFIVNDDIALARQCDADGVHLGRDDGKLTHARHQLGAQSIIGISCYNDFGRALWASHQGADYLAFGRFFPSTSKPEAVKADTDLLQQARKQLQLPLVAIGGITPENGHLPIAAGADMLAVIQAVFGQTDITAACRAFARLFDASPRRTQ